MLSGVSCPPRMKSLRHLQRQFKPRLLSPSCCKQQPHRSCTSMVFAPALTSISARSTFARHLSAGPGSVENHPRSTPGLTTNTTHTRSCLQHGPSRGFGTFPASASASKAGQEEDSFRVRGGSNVLENHVKRRLERHPPQSEHTRVRLQRMGQFAAQLKIDKLLAEFGRFMETGHDGVGAGVGADTDDKKNDNRRRRARIHDLLAHEILFHACGKMKDGASIAQTVRSMRDRRLRANETTNRYILRAYFDAGDPKAAIAHYLQLKDESDGLVKLSHVREMLRGLAFSGPEHWKMADSIERNLQSLKEEATASTASSASSASFLTQAYAQDYIARLKLAANMRDRQRVFRVYDEFIAELAQQEGSSRQDSLRDYQYKLAYSRSVYVWAIEALSSLPVKQQHDRSLAKAHQVFDDFYHHLLAYRHHFPSSSPTSSSSQPSQPSSPSSSSPSSSSPSSLSSSSLSSSSSRDFTDFGEEDCSRLRAIASAIFQMHCKAATLKLKERSMEVRQGKHKKKAQTSSRISRDRVNNSDTNDRNNHSNTADDDTEHNDAVNRSSGGMGSRAHNDQHSQHGGGSRDGIGAHIDSEGESNMVRAQPHPGAGRIFYLLQKHNVPLDLFLLTSWMDLHLLQARNMPVPEFLPIPTSTTHPSFPSLYPNAHRDSQHTQSLYSTSEPYTPVHHQQYAMLPAASAVGDGEEEEGPYSEGSESSGHDMSERVYEHDPAATSRLSDGQARTPSKGFVRGMLQNFTGALSGDTHTVVRTPNADAAGGSGHGHRNGNGNGNGNDSGNGNGNGNGIGIGIGIGNGNGNGIGNGIGDSDGDGEAVGSQLAFMQTLASSNSKSECALQFLDDVRSMGLRPDHTMYEKVIMHVIESSSNAADKQEQYQLCELNFTMVEHLFDQMTREGLTPHRRVFRHLMKYAVRSNNTPWIWRVVERSEEFLIQPDLEYLRVMLQVNRSRRWQDSKKRDLTSPIYAGKLDAFIAKYGPRMQHRQAYHQLLIDYYLQTAPSKVKVLMKQMKAEKVPVDPKVVRHIVTSLAASGWAGCSQAVSMFLTCTKLPIYPPKDANVSGDEGDSDGRGDSGSLRSGTDSLVDADTMNDDGINERDLSRYQQYAFDHATVRMLMRTCEKHGMIVELHEVFHQALRANLIGLNTCTIIFESLLSTNLVSNSVMDQTIDLLKMVTVKMTTRSKDPASLLRYIEGKLSPRSRENFRDACQLLNTPKYAGKHGTDSDGGARVISTDRGADVSAGAAGTGRTQTSPSSSSSSSKPSPNSSKGARAASGLGWLDASLKGKIKIKPIDNSKSQK